MEALRRFVCRRMEDIKGDPPGAAVITTLCWLLVLLILGSLLWQALSLLLQPQILAEQMMTAAGDDDFLYRRLGNILGIAVTAVILWLARR